MKIKVSKKSPCLEIINVDYVDVKGNKNKLVDVYLQVPGLQDVNGCGVFLGSLVYPLKKFLCETKRYPAENAFFGEESVEKEVPLPEGFENVCEKQVGKDERIYRWAFDSREPPLQVVYSKNRFGFCLRDRKGNLSRLNFKDLYFVAGHKISEIEKVKREYS